MRNVTPQVTAMRGMGCQQMAQAAQGLLAPIPLVNLKAQVFRSGTSSQTHTSSRHWNKGREFASGSEEDVRASSPTSGTDETALRCNTPPWPHHNPISGTDYPQKPSECSIPPWSHHILSPLPHSQSTLRNLVPRGGPARARLRLRR